MNFKIFSLRFINFFSKELFNMNRNFMLYCIGEEKAKILDKCEHLNAALCTLKYMSRHLRIFFIELIAGTMNDFIIK